MNCLAPERFVDLLDRGGLDAASAEEKAHLQDCDACQGSWATVAAAGEVLAKARPRQPGRAIRLIPLIAAAAILLTIVGVIAASKRPPAATKQVKDPLTLFLQGTPEEAKVARAALLKVGRTVLPGLVALRPRLKDSARLPDLQNLIWAIKRDAAQDPAATLILDKLETMKIDLQFEKTTFDDALAFIRSFSLVNLFLDPTIDGGTVVQLNLKDSTLRSALEILCAVKDLDFDVKYGVVFLSKPLRLWSTDPAVGLPAVNLWRAGTPDPADAALIDKLHSVRIDMDAWNMTMSNVAAFLQDLSKVKFSASPGIETFPMTFKVGGLPLEHTVELVTLPYGWDARIDNGSVLLFRPAR